MSVDETPTFDETPSFFVGRDKLIRQVQQYLSTEGETGALLVIGRPGVGKSALLRHFDRLFDPANIGVYLSLASLTPPLDEASLLRALIAASDEALYARLTHPSLPSPPEEADADTLRAWLQGSYLPAAVRALRQRRRLVWLLDDAEWLIDQRLDPSLFAAWQAMLNDFPRLRLVMAINHAYEMRLDALGPLVRPGLVHRLGHLNATETAELIKHLYPEATESAHAAVYRATGGQPRLVHHYGEAIAALPKARATWEDVQAITPQIYTVHEATLTELWQSLSSEEKQVVRALMGLRDGPDAPVTAPRLERWLMETEMPIDATTIHATLRSLEYRELVSSTAEGVELRLGLLARWLRQHEPHLTDLETSTPGATSRLIGALALGGLVLLLMALILLAQTPNPDFGGLPLSPQATVTLAP